ncbi:hypothetical protein AAFX24_27375 [Vibrio mediterranei]|uniref:hypothetical protein n=1 Tax=Vibrio mediterranei TaxID=689 RepID=UPI0038CDF4A1
MRYFKYWKSIHLLVFIISSIVLSLLLYGSVNAYFCKYDLYLKWDDVSQTNLTCKGGQVTAIHLEIKPAISKGDNSEVVSRWKVSARQLLIGNQLIYLVYERKRVSHKGELISEVDDYNYLVDGFNMLFYHVERNGDNLYIFQTFPDTDVVKATVSGNLGLEGGQ